MVRRGYLQSSPIKHLPLTTVKRLQRLSLTFQTISCTEEFPSISGIPQLFPVFPPSGHPAHYLGNCSTQLNSTQPEITDAGVCSSLVSEPKPSLHSLKVLMSILQCNTIHTFTHYAHIYTY